MNYRPEIDGLRALAVLPVIFYHAGFTWMPGGFVGVDVFLVISGYLITAIILNDLGKGCFSLGAFYERRARRILPALSVVLMVSLPFAWWLLLPAELVDFAASLVAVVLFAANVLFWWQTDYFAASAEQIPLLHTWSLAVEEQYYLLFPLLLGLAWRWGKLWVIVMLAVVALLSFGVAEWLWRQSLAANFYLLPSRAWELLLGALAAVYLQKPVVTLPHGVAQLASLCGLGLLVVAVFTLHQGIPFPSVYTLIPTLGTLLIILFVTPTTWVGQLLALRPLVWIGLISYSAYLWHQPVFVFARLLSLEPPSQPLMAGLTVLTLVLAYASWRWVEQPLRQRRYLTQRGVFVGVALGCGLVLVSIAVLVIMADGFPKRFAE